MRPWRGRNALSAQGVAEAEYSMANGPAIDMNVCVWLGYYPPNLPPGYSLTPFGVERTDTPAPNLPPG